MVSVWLPPTEDPIDVGLRHAIEYSQLVYCSKCGYAYLQHGIEPRDHKRVCPRCRRKEEYQ